MRKIKVCIETGYAGCDHEDEFEVEDDVSDSEIDQMVWEFVCDCMTITWKEEE